MNYIVNSLAQYEVHVARYYYNRGAYVAAINRRTGALTDYREVPALEEALYIMLRSYDALGMTQLRDDAQRVMTTNYPKSELPGRGLQAAQDNHGGRSGSLTCLPLESRRSATHSRNSASVFKRRMGGNAASSRLP